MDNLRSFLGIRSDKVKNEKIREIVGVKKGVNELINENVLRWFGHMERMDIERSVKRVYKSDCVGRNRPGKPRSRWIDNVNKVLKERGKTLASAKALAKDREKWKEFVRGNARGTLPS